MISSSKEVGRYYLGGYVMERSIFDVVDFVLGKYPELTTMKLQKLMYYIQAWSLAWDDKPMFKEEFQAWANGPVCHELFKKHKGKFVVTSEDFEAREYEFSETELDTIEAVLDFYGDKEPHWLSELTHSEDPWLLARDGCAPGDSCNKVISKESMQEYYGSL